MQPINILHIMTRLPVGGVENQLLKVLRSYDRKRLSPLVCSLSNRGEIGKEIEAEGIEVVCLEKLGHKFDRSIVSDLQTLMKEREIKIVRTHQYHANLYGRLAARKAEVPCIVASVHNLYTRDRKLHRRLFNRHLSKNTDRVVAVSSAVKSDILKYDRIPKEKITVIHNGVVIPKIPLTKSKRARAGLGISPGDKVVGTVGRLTYQKGLRHLLEAASTLTDALPGLRLLIVGDGPERGKLEDTARDLGISDKTFFLGMRRDVPELLSAMDVFVLPSLWEGFGNALLEAMAASRPVIASDIPPSREVVGHEKNGLLVPVKDSSAIAASIKRLLRYPSLSERLGDAASKTVAANYTMEATVKKYMSLFSEILKGKGLKGP
jgi:glycosyltransferase involved in cell wall biosynthesis